MSILNTLNLLYQLSSQNEMHEIYVKLLKSRLLEQSDMELEKYDGQKRTSTNGQEDQNIHYHIWRTPPKVMYRQTLYTIKWWRKRSGKCGGLCQEDKCYLQKYATQSKETIVKTESAELNLEKYLANVSKKENKENRLKWQKKKVLHGQFVGETECHNESKKWQWLRK